MIGPENVANNMSNCTPYITLRIKKTNMPGKTMSLEDGSLMKLPSNMDSMP